MGCDIHAFIEARRVGGKWGLMEEDAITSRCYTLFGLLAGVRGCDELFEARGLPSDVSAPVRRYCDADEYLHSMSWLSFAEGLTVLFEMYRLDYPVPSAFITALESMHKLRLAGLEARLVFCFDS